MFFYCLNIVLLDASIGCSQNVTGNNDRFLRNYWEVKFDNTRDDKWKPYAKGGGFRRWSGNIDVVINWTKEAKLIYQTGHASQMVNEESFGKLGITWGLVTSGEASFRLLPRYATYDKGGSSIFLHTDKDTFSVLSLLNSCVAKYLLNCSNPTLNFQVENIRNIPVVYEAFKNAADLSEQSIFLSQTDWDNFETSWDFKTHPLTRYKTNLIQQAFENWQQQTESAFQQLKQLEEENNRYWIAAYGLQDELTPEVPDAQITIRRADLTRDIKSLLSYAVGCIMGRYSLENEGLQRSPLAPLAKGKKDDLEVPLHKGKESVEVPLFKEDLGGSFGIIPITDKAYFTDDIVDQIIEFLKTAFSLQHLQANLDYIANSLTLRTGENSRDRIRRYFLDEFVKDHIQTYKKRPIYWYFTSGKKKAFGALVYLHRYDTTTLARLRTDYVLELQRKIDNEIQREQQNLELLTTTAAKKTSQKLIKDLQDQQIELREYQAKLQHAADKRIAIDLDDGVAYNYTLFEGLVYEGAELKMADLKKKSEWKRKNQ